MVTVNLYLAFNGNCETAFNLYKMVSYDYTKV